MTSFTVGYNWTPDLIAKDKKLKEKFGSAAHIIPAKTTANLVERMPLKDTLEKVPVKKKNNKTRNILLVAGGLILTAASLYLFRGKISNILSRFSGKSAAVENNISERILANGKKVQKIVEKTEDGSQKVIMNVFDEAGNLVINKEKVITRSVNKANGKKYIDIKNTYNAPGFADVKKEGIPFQFNKNMSINTNKYYDAEGKLLFKTETLKEACSSIKDRRVYDINGKANLSTLTNYDLMSGCRRYRITWENPCTQAATHTSNRFSSKGTALKRKNS